MPNAEHVAYLRALLAFAPFVSALPTVDVVSDAGETPIRVERCTVSEQAVQENPKVGYRMPQVSALTISYTNESDVAAAEIHFRVRYQGTTTTVTDRGTFAPGQKITHSYDGPNTIFSTDYADCSVIAVTFVTGATWSAPSQLSTDPASANS